jgi:hypothetical protein
MEELFSSLSPFVYTQREDGEREIRIKIFDFFLLSLLILLLQLLLLLLSMDILFGGKSDLLALLYLRYEARDTFFLFSFCFFFLRNFVSEGIIPDEIYFFLNFV